MIPVPSGEQVWLATGFTDMRKGFDGLAALVQDHLRRDPFSGQAFVFRGRQGRLIKVLWWDGQGLCLFAKRLERGRLRHPRRCWPRVPRAIESIPGWALPLQGADRLAPVDRRERFREPSKPH
jgi:transposase